MGRLASAVDPCLDRGVRAGQAATMLAQVRVP